VTGTRRALVALTVGAALLRLAAATARPAWHDEYFTSWIAGRSWSSMIEALRNDSGPPLPYAAVKALAATGLDPLAGGRGLAVLLGTLAVLLVWRAATRTWGEEAGLWAGALLATHPLAVAWASEARAYPWLLLATVWGWERLEAVAANHRLPLWGLGAAVALACWSHALGLVAAFALALASFTLPATARRRALRAVAVGLATFLPWMPVALGQPQAATSWIERAWAGMPLVAQLVAPLRLLPPLAPFGQQLDMVSAPAALQAAAAVLMLVALLSARWRVRPAVLALAPAAGVTAVALLGAGVYYPSRAEALWLAALLSLVAAGSARARIGRWVGTALLVAGVATVAASVAAWRQLPPRPERQIAKAVAASLPAGGTVVVSGPWRLGVWAALGAQRARWELVTVPASARSHPGWSAPGLEPLGERELESLHRELAIRVVRGGGVVLVVAADPSGPALERLAVALGCPPCLALPGARVLGPCAGAAPGPPPLQP